MIFPSRAFYRPGEPLEIAIPGRFQAVIWHLGERVAQLQGGNRLNWTPPSLTRRGYVVEITGGGQSQWTAFDVLEKWTDAPRYGYLFDFRPERTNFDLDWLLAHHVNGLQFYDWLYRHDTLVPPTPLFADPLGRSLSLDSVRCLIDAAHQRGMAAMPYAAIYAASPPFASQHPQWGLYHEKGALYDFANGFLKLMNPASCWRDHLVAECVSALKALPFDGIHLDQYGEPQTGFDAQGQAVNLPQALADTLHAVYKAIPDDKALLFNLVHNWPVEAIAPTPVDFPYCELWPPMITLGDLARIADLNRAQFSGRPPVIAVYLNPAQEYTVRAAESVLMASGAYHIVHGEDGRYLSDPYFPKAQRPSAELASHLKRLADFGVAYEELLTFGEPVSVSASFDGDLWLLSRRSGQRLALNFVNASPRDVWNAELAARTICQQVAVEIKVEAKVAKVWSASPDRESPPTDLPFTQNGQTARFTIPQVQVWTLVCLELDR